MIICPICDKTVTPEVVSQNIHQVECSYYSHSCNPTVYPYFWGYFDKERKAVELLICFERTQYYYELPNGWAVETGHHDDIRVITEGDSCLSLNDAYVLLKRYDSLLAFS